MVSKASRVLQSLYKTKIQHYDLTIGSECSTPEDDDERREREEREAHAKLLIEIFVRHTYLMVALKKHVV